MTTYVLVKQAKKQVAEQMKAGSKDDFDLIITSGGDVHQWKHASSLTDGAGRSLAVGGHRVRSFSTGSRVLPDIPEEQEEEEKVEELPPNTPLAQTAVERPRCDSITSSDAGSVSTMRERTDSNASSVSSTIRYFGSSLSIGSLDQFQSESISRDKRRNRRKSVNRPFWKRVILDSKLLVNPMFWVLATSGTMFNLAFPNVLLYIPARVLQLGLSLEEAAYLLSFTALMDAGGRLIIPLVAQTIQPKFIYLPMGCFATISILGLAFAETFITLGVSTSIFGCASGACAVVMTPILFEYLGKLHFIFALILSQVIQGVVFIVVSPLVGLLIDETNSIPNAFFVLALLQGLSVVAWIAEPYAVKHQKRTAQSTTNPEDGCD